METALTGTIRHHRLAPKSAVPTRTIVAGVSENTLGRARRRGFLHGGGVDLGLTRFAVSSVIELATRRVEIAGIMAEPDSAWVVQCGRQVTDAVDGFLIGKHFVLNDRDPVFGKAFRETLAAAGVQTVRLPPRSPNLNAFAERFVRTIQESCLDRLILIGEASLRRAIREFVAHYHGERNHQGLQNQLIIDPGAHRRDGTIACRERLGGLLKYYHRPAA